MNDNTRRQWQRHCADHGLDAVARMVLYALVHDHSAVEDLSRPGQVRIMELSGVSKNTVTPTLRRLEESGHVVRLTTGRYHGRRAAEYAVPWLNNPVDKPTRDARRRSSHPKSGAQTGVQTGVPPLPYGSRATTPPSTPAGDDVVAIADALATHVAERDPARYVDENGYEHPTICACSECLEFDPERRP